VVEKNAIRDFAASLDLPQYAKMIKGLTKAGEGHDMFASKFDLKQLEQLARGKGAL